MTDDELAKELDGTRPMALPWRFMRLSRRDGWFFTHKDVQEGRNMAWVRQVIFDDPGGLYNLPVFRHTIYAQRGDTSFCGRDGMIGPDGHITLTIHDFVLADLMDEIDARLRADHPNLRVIGGAPANVRDMTHPSAIPHTNPRLPWGELKPFPRRFLPT